MIVKHYNSTLKIGFNSWQEVYSSDGVLIKPKEHFGRLVYTNKRIPLKRIVAGVDQHNFEIRFDYPF